MKTLSPGACSNRPSPLQPFSQEKFMAIRMGVEPTPTSETVKSTDHYATGPRKLTHGDETKQQTKL